MGQHDAVVISEAPHDESYIRLVLSIDAQGNIRTTTLKAFPEEAATRAVRNIP